MNKEIILKTQLMYLLCDVIDSIQVDLAPELRKARAELHRDEKRKFSDLQKAAQVLQVRAKDVSSQLYHLEMTDIACEDSDWLKEIIELAVDRCSTTDADRIMLRAQLFNMKSKLGIA